MSSVSTDTSVASLQERELGTYELSVTKLCANVASVSRERGLSTSPMLMEASLSTTGITCASRSSETSIRARKAGLLTSLKLQRSKRNCYLICNEVEVGLVKKREKTLLILGRLQCDLCRRLRSRFIAVIPRCDHELFPR